jgi:hypothetical protein
MSVTGMTLPLMAADLSILVPGLYLAGALLLGALIVGAVSHWRRQTRPRGQPVSDQLAHFRSLYEQGAISEEEFNRLRGVLGGELRRTLEVPAVPAPNPPSPRPHDAGASEPGPEDTGYRPA